MTGMDGEDASTGAARTMRSDAQRSERVLVRAATTAIHREGLHVPLGTIAADAGVGIGTLYRHFPTRAALLAHLTHRSFEQVLANARDAERLGTTPRDALRRFIEAAITQRNDLILPLHGGPAITAAATLAVRDEVHHILQEILDQGRVDRSLKPDLTPRDIVIFGAMLAQPHPIDDTWDNTCRRLLTTYLDGLRAKPE
jgi:AcrR family transcriptional regulator